MKKSFQDLFSAKLEKLCIQISIQMSYLDFVTFVFATSIKLGRLGDIFKAKSFQLLLTIYGFKT
jgi:hypothetical protein